MCALCSRACEHTRWVSEGLSACSSVPAIPSGCLVAMPLGSMRCGPQLECLSLHLARCTAASRCSLMKLAHDLQELQVASASKFCCSSAELPAGAGVLHCVTLDRLRVSCVPVQPAAEE